MIDFTARCQLGVDFYGFLKDTDRLSITDRLELRTIYNQEFRNREAGVKYTNFGSVLYALKLSKKIRRRGDTITFNSTIKQLYLNQWIRPRIAEQPSVQPEDNSPNNPQGNVSTNESGTRRTTQWNQARSLVKMLNTDKTLFGQDKNGINVTCQPPFENGKLSLNVGTTEVSLCLRVENNGATPVYFTYYSPLRWVKAFTFHDEQKVTRKNPLLLKPDDTYTIKVNVHCTHLGCFLTTLTFEFKADLQPSTVAFHIWRYIEAHCTTDLGRELAPVSPYNPRCLPPCTYEPNFRIVDGQRPEGSSVSQLSYTVLLKPYAIPQDMNDLIRALKQPSVFHSKRELLESELSWQNYSEKFSTMLFLEELQLQVDIRKYNIPNDQQDSTEMTRDRNKKLLVLEVVGVSENRPSVLRRDELLVHPEGNNNVKYRGYVHSVLRDSIKLGFGQELLNLFEEGMKFKVEFTLNRLPMRLQHRAAMLAVSSNLRSVLFPAANSSSNQQAQLPRLRLFNRQLEANPEQHRAIQQIVAGSSRPFPYLLFGPPGTGKTVTVVEAIKQIESTNASCHILACAPSNSAADLICKRLVETHVDKHKVYRLYANCLDPSVIPEELKACSNLVGDSFEYPNKETLMTYKIIVSTMITAGRLVSRGIPPGHFTHVFLDEAGHAVELECLIPLAGLLDPKSGQVVLAGDHKQLGPIIRSPLALNYGMGVSFLERLMCNFSLYQKQNDVYDSRFVTKLLRNYRSHPAILQIPNELFYDGELQVCADEILRNSFCAWEHLPQKDFPVIFHGVKGIDQREACSPSFFNVAEVEVLIFYVKKLMETSGKKGKGTLLPKEIGIIAPYRKQVQKIRKALEKVSKELRISNMNDIKVGSVEEFQGQERKVIMVSTVRSSRNYLQIDQKFHLGFIKDEKRFNVAMTRAKALLIVVGNPKILKTDPTWERFINYCTDRGGFIPTETEEEEEADEEIVERLSVLYLNIVHSDEPAESGVQQHLEPEGRSEM